MTGPLAQQFASLWAYVAPEPRDSHVRAALSVIERHVQDMDALALDMGEELRAWLEMSRHAGNAESPTTAALLARLDQLGKEPHDTVA